jgi:hypothetical protein
MCQMCEEYEAELRRLGIEPEPAEREKRHVRDVPVAEPREPEPQPADRHA